MQPDGKSHTRYIAQGIQNKKTHSNYIPTTFWIWGATRKNKKCNNRGAPLFAWNAFFLNGGDPEPKIFGNYDGEAIFFFFFMILAVLPTPWDFLSHSQVSRVLAVLFFFLQIRFFSGRGLKLPNWGTLMLQEKKWCAPTISSKHASSPVIPTML